MNYNDRSYTNLRGLNLTAKNGCVRFVTPTTTPTTTGDERILYCNGSDQLIFDDGASATALGSSGVVSSFGLNDAYDDGTSITVDGGAVTLNGSHATNVLLDLNYSGVGTGNMIDIQNGSSGSQGYDIIGTDDTWSITSPGVIVATGLTMLDSEIITLGTGSDATIQWDAAKLDIDAAAINFDGPVTVETGHAFTVSGTASSDYLIVTAGDVLLSEGSIVLTDDDNAASLSVTNDGATTAGAAADTGVVNFVCDTLTTGTLLHLSTTEGTLNGGFYLRCWDETDDQAEFTVGENGAVTIVGKATTDVLTITDGDLVVTQGSITITADDDNAATLSLVNDTATTADVVSFTGSGAFTGDSFMLVSPSGLTTGRAVEVTCAALTTGEALYVTTDAITSGKGIYVTNAGEAITSGELLTVLNNESGDIATITGNVVSFTSAIEEDTGILTANYDLALFSRTDKQSHASQYDAQGSVVKIAKTQNKAAGTIVDAVIGLEIVSTATGSALILGDSVSVTSVGVNERSLNVVNAVTGKDAVLITASGAITNGLAALHVTATGNLAAGGAALMLDTNTGTPTVTSRLMELASAKDMVGIYSNVDGKTHDVYYFEGGGDIATTKAMMNLNLSGDPADDTVAVLKVQNTGTTTHESKGIYVVGGDITGLMIDTDSVYSAANDSGAITLFSDAAGDLPVFMNFYHSDAAPAAGEFCGKIFFYGSDDVPGKELYASIEVEMEDVATGAPDGILWIKGDLAGSNTNSAGFTGNTVMLGAAAATLTTAGSWNLTISTALTAANEPRIVLIDGDAGNITLTAGGATGEIVMASPVVHSSTDSIAAGVEGAISIATSITELATDADQDDYTLADGAEGQIKFIILKTDGGGTAVITPAHMSNNTSISFADADDGCVLLFTNAAWYVVGNNGGAIT